MTGTEEAREAAYRVYNRAYDIEFNETGHLNPKRSIMAGVEATYDAGVREGIRLAREAVASVEVRMGWQSHDIRAALAAIDALEADHG